MRIGILTSGGDAPGMNGAIRAAAVVALALGHEPIGIRHGYRGLVNGELEPLDALSVETYCGAAGRFSSRRAVRSSTNLRCAPPPATCSVTPASTD